MEYTNFFNVLSNQTRVDIVSLLNYEKLKASQISRKLYTSIQTLKPHINLLTDTKIIIKDSNDFFKLSSVGKIILQQISFFEFCAKNKSFFKEHIFGDIPPSLLNQLGNLNEFEYVDGFSPNLTRWKDIIKNTKSHLYCIFSQPPILVADEILDKISQKIDFRLLFGKNSTITKNNEFVLKLELDKPRKDESFQLRIANIVQMNLILSDNQSCLMFPNNNFETDMQKSFVSKNSEFLRWSRDFFYHKWDESEKISRIRVS